MAKVVVVHQKPRIKYLYVLESQKSTAAGATMPIMLLKSLAHGITCNVVRFPNPLATFKSVGESD